MRIWDISLCCFCMCFCVGMRVCVCQNVFLRTPCVTGFTFQRWGDETSAFAGTYCVGYEFVKCPVFIVFRRAIKHVLKLTGALHSLLWYFVVCKNKHWSSFASQNAAAWAAPLVHLLRSLLQWPRFESSPGGTATIQMDYWKKNTSTRGWDKFIIGWFANTEVF